MPDWAAKLLGPDRADSSELLYGRPPEAILETWIALEAICLDLADAAEIPMGVPCCTRP